MRRAYRVDEPIRNSIWLELSLLMTGFVRRAYTIALNIKACIASEQAN